jgi:hypothetical protein
MSWDFPFSDQIENEHALQSWHFDAVTGRGSPLHSLGVQEAHLSFPETFSPRKTPKIFVILSDFFVAVLLGFWGAGAWLLAQLLHGRSFLSILLFPLWVCLALVVFLALHRSGRVRLWVSITTTVLVLLGTVAVVTGRT